MPRRSARRRAWAAWLAALATLTGTAAAAQDAAQDDPPQTRPTPRWLAEANARIEVHRKGDLQVEVVDADGRPAAGARVRVALRRHAYGFGTAVNGRFLADAADPDNAPYREAIARYFNKATLENGHKWRFWENRARRAQTVAATDWLAANGLILRGHALLWQHDNPAYSLPDDVMSRVTRPNFSPADAAFVRGRVEAHVRDLAGFYAGNIAEWDVVNEQYAHHLLTDRLDPDAAKERAPELTSWFAQARAADPAATLYLNDYGLLSGDDAAHRDSFFETVRFLQTQNAPVGGVGFQCHFTRGGDAPAPEALYERLERFAGLGLAMQATEFDCFGGGWGETDAQREARQAAFLREFYTVFFSHPGTVGIVMWGFWDERHWQDSAPLFRRDWSLKPSGRAYLDLVFGEWWTDETVTTDAAGRARVRGFLGEYAVSARDAAGRPGLATVSLAREGASVRVVLAAPPQSERGP